MLWHIFENGWEDKEFLRQRVYGVDEIRKQVAKWPPYPLAGSSTAVTTHPSSW